LVDYTGRLFRDRKAALSRDLAPIFDRLGASAEGRSEGFPSNRL
jgi:hypothetical protein